MVETGRHNQHCPEGRRVVVRTIELHNVKTAVNMPGRVTTRCLVTAGALARSLRVAATVGLVLFNQFSGVLESYQ